MPIYIIRERFGVRQQQIRLFLNWKQEKFDFLWFINIVKFWFF